MRKHCHPLLLLHNNQFLSNQNNTYLLLLNHNHNSYYHSLIRSQQWSKCMEQSRSLHRVINQKMKMINYINAINKWVVALLLHKLSFLHCRRNCLPQNNQKNQKKINHKKKLLYGSIIADEPIVVFLTIQKRSLLNLKI